MSNWHNAGCGKATHDGGAELDWALYDGKHNVSVINIDKVGDAMDLARKIHRQ